MNGAREFPSADGRKGAPFGNGARGRGALLGAARLRAGHPQPAGGADRHGAAACDVRALPTHRIGRRLDRNRRDRPVRRQPRQLPARRLHGAREPRARRRGLAGARQHGEVCARRRVRRGRRRCRDAAAAPLACAAADGPPRRDGRRVLRAGGRAVALRARRAAWWSATSGSGWRPRCGRLDPSPPSPHAVPTPTPRRPHADPAPTPRRPHASHPGHPYPGQCRPRCHRDGGRVHGPRVAAVRLLAHLPPTPLP